MHSQFPAKDVTGVVLAGGKSLRYGKNKAFEKIDGIPLVERVIGVIRPIFENLAVITNTPGEYAGLGLPMYEDLVKGLGPIGGVYTALCMISGQAGFFVACDMPFLNGELIEHMVSIRDDFDIVVPRVGDKLEALHALYSKRCTPAIKGLIEAREYQIIRFFSDFSVRYVEEAEIRQFDPALRSFFNVNNPQVLRGLQRG